MDGTVAPKPIGFAPKAPAAKVVPVLTAKQINERNEKLKVIRNGAQTLARYVNEKIDSVPKLKDLNKVINFSFLALLMTSSKLSTAILIPALHSFKSLIVSCVGMMSPSF